MVNPNKQSQNPTLTAKKKQKSDHLNAKAPNNRSSVHTDKKSTKIPSEQVEIDYSFDTESDITKIISNQYVGLNVFFVVMMLLATAILWTGVKVSMQIQNYRHDYKQLQEMKQQYLQLQVEHKRLLIEQQTFSSTPQIANRAISKLNMYFPTINDKQILQPEPIDSQLSTQKFLDQSINNESTDFSQSTDVAEVNQ